MYATLITPNIYIGTYPKNETDVDRLKLGSKTTAVLNLQTDQDIRKLKIDWPELERAYRARDMIYRRWPIIDLSSTNLEIRLEGALDILDELLVADHCVYVHCTAGIRRAPAVVIGYLTWCQGMSLNAAIKLVNRRRPCSPIMTSIFAVHVTKNY